MSDQKDPNFTPFIVDKNRLAWSTPALVSIVTATVVITAQLYSIHSEIGALAAAMKDNKRKTWSVDKMRALAKLTELQNKEWHSPDVDSVNREINKEDEKYP